MRDVIRRTGEEPHRTQMPTDPRGPASGTPPAGAGAAGWLADCHVHLHDRFEPGAFLDGAVRNLAGAALRLGVDPHSVGCLFLTETREQRGFLRLQHGIGGGWASETTAERTSLLLRRGDTAVLVVIAGRQVVTRERLEVLLLGSSVAVPDGESVDRTLGMAMETDGLVVLPWGFGKWLSARGRTVERLLTSADASALFVGDTANRPAALPVPRLLRWARDLGIRVLPGSDPLPLSFHVRRAGRCGIFLECAPDLRGPAEQIKRLLLGTRSQPAVFRQPESLVPFAVAQTLMQLTRRTRSGPSAGVPA